MTKTKKIIALLLTVSLLLATGALSLGVAAYETGPIPVPGSGIGGSGSGSGSGSGGSGSGSGSGSVVYGDPNGDNIVDGRDVITLCNFLANYDYDTGSSTVSVTAGADANGDTFVDGRDVIILCNYLANFDYDTGSSTVVLGPQN